MLLRHCLKDENLPFFTQNPSKGSSMNRLLIFVCLVSALPVYADDKVSDADSVTPICRRSYLKLKLYLAPQQVSLGGGVNFGAGGGVDPRQYCMPQAPQVYTPPQLYAPTVPETRPAPEPMPIPRYMPQVVCPELVEQKDNCDILTKLAVLHYLANNDARRDSRRDADRGDSEINKDSVAALQLFQNRDRNRDDLNRETAATLKILENQMTQIGLSQAQTLLLQEIVAGMRQAVQLPAPTPSPSQLPYQPPGPERGPAPVPPPAPAYRSSSPSSMKNPNRTFYHDTVYRK
jgi:hypothetical protein